MQDTSPRPSGPLPSRSLPSAPATPGASAPPASVHPTGLASGSTPVRPAVAALLLGLVILLWGANWPVMKVGVELMPPVTFAAARMVLGCATLFLVAAAAGQARLPSRHDRRIVVWVGLLQMAAFVLLIALALQIVPAGRSAILSYTTPLWVLPMAMLVLGERLTWMKGAGLVAGLAGVAVLFNPAGFDWGDSGVLLGNGLLLLAALAWAVNIVQVRGHRWEGTPLSLGPWQALVASLVLVPAALLLEGGRGIEWSGTLAAVLVYNGPVSTAFCFWAMVTVTRALPAITTSLGTLGTPVVGLLLSSWWLGEPLTWTNLTGLGLIGSGLVLVALSESRGLGSRGGGSRRAGSGRG